MFLLLRTGRKIMYLHFSCTEIHFYVAHRRQLFPIPKWYPAPIDPYFHSLVFYFRHEVANILLIRSGLAFKFTTFKSTYSLKNSVESYCSTKVKYEPIEAHQLFNTFFQEAHFRHHLESLCLNMSTPIVNIT